MTDPIQPSIEDAIEKAVEDPTDIETEKTHDTRRRTVRSLWTAWVAGALVLFVVALGMVAGYLAHQATPLLRQRIVATLEGRFHSHVTLDTLEVSLLRGIEVRGSGLKIQYLAGPAEPDKRQMEGRGDASPMLSVDQFTFRTTLRDLLHMRAHIDRVYVHGLELRLPPHSIHATPARPSSRRPPFALMADTIECADVHLVTETSTPGKPPLTIEIQSLTLHDVGAGAPMVYVADLTNPKPTGHIHATGHFGPWVGADPRSTAVDGDYRFEHADLGTIKGIAGTLDSTGHFAGQLGRIVVDGTTETPNFALDVSARPEPLATTFHAIVDGTSGDTTLAPVVATLGRSQFTAQGNIMKVHLNNANNGPDGAHSTGHDIALDVTMQRGRIEDLLQLGMRTWPPVMRGEVTMHTRLHILPGPQRVAARMQLAGGLAITGVEFSNAALQDKVDGLSMRAQGKPQDVHAAGSDRRAEVASQMAVQFSLDQELLTVPSLQYEVPGAQVRMDGVYSLDGNLFEFKGHVRTEATASQMVTGWKSLLLKPLDPLLRRDGAGVELPISISGTGGDVHVGLATSTNESPQAMAADLKAKRQAKKTGQ